MYSQENMQRQNFDILRWKQHLQSMLNVMLDMEYDTSLEISTGTRNAFGFTSENANHTITIEKKKVNKKTLYKIIFKHKVSDGIVITSLDCDTEHNVLTFAIVDMYQNNPKRKYVPGHLSISDVIANGLGLAYLYAKKKDYINTIVFSTFDSAKVPNSTSLYWVDVFSIICTRTPNFARSVYDTKANLPGWRREDIHYSHGGKDMPALLPADEIPDLVYDAAAVLCHKRFMTGIQGYDAVEQIHSAMHGLTLRTKQDKVYIQRLEQFIQQSKRSHRDNWMQYLIRLTVTWNKTDAKGNFQDINFADFTSRKNPSFPYAWLRLRM